MATWVAAPTMVMFLCAGRSGAQNSSADYTFLVGSGFLCDHGAAGTCPAVAKSANGDRYQMSGAGTFNTPGKSVTAAGSFSHESANGVVLETGVWLANELVRFDSYGVAPGALLSGGLAFGRAPGGPRRLPVAGGFVPTGGLAVFRIRLLPVLGAVKIAVLEVNCALGDAPAGRSTEGIRLTFGKTGTGFSEEGSGRVMFLTMRTETSEAAKPPK